MAEQYDLVIVGAGPAGLMAAAWASVYGLETRLIDKRANPIVNGHADGLQSRTIEILHSFGFGDQIYKEANRLQEVCFWNPDSHGLICRTDRIPDTIPGISSFQQSVLHQGRIEQCFFDFISKSSKVRIDRPTAPTNLYIDEQTSLEEDSYPISLTLKTPADHAKGGQSNGHTGGHTDAPSSETTINCRYLIGCDGAHSWVRDQLGIEMEGEQTESVWGVMDIVPITNFPDIRMRCAIHSQTSGTIMVIPRERNLVRLYIQLASLSPALGERFDRTTVTPQTIFQAAQKILQPYEISYDYCEWWTVYQIGQRVGNKYGVNDRVFLAGDAVHSHSPKAGQGMNVSMQDTYNLVWKIASVVKKITKPSILATYETERRTIAQELIEFDRRFSSMFSGRPARDIADAAGISMKEFKATFEKGNIFTSGISVKYGPSVLVHEAGKNLNGQKNSFLRPWLGGVEIGRRFPSFQVVHQADATPIHLGDKLKSDGRWRLVVFCGDLTDKNTATRLERVGERLCQSTSLSRRLITGDDIVTSPPIEVLLVHSSPRRSVELMDLPDVFIRLGSTKRYDYYRVFADDSTYHHGHGNAYQGYDVDKEAGCSVLLRPDQYIGWMGGLEDHEQMEHYLSCIFR